MPLTVGTAGHIDHGKTWLVRALTGKDTDRLPEERKRGISIDLGYAPLELPDGRRLSLVDVPGHERFVRTMVAGATGIDLFLLVVDAAEGARPQTHEHLAILRLLGIEQGVVAVTKVDAVDEETRELALLEARELVPDAAVVATSARTSEGVDDLRAALGEAAERVEARPSTRPARLFVDRVFSLRGIGTVATGTLWSGTVGEGDALRAEPVGLDVRVRSVQVHDRAVERADAGQRVAVALPGVERAELRRGDALVEPGAYPVSYRLDVALEPLAEVPDGMRLHVHHGTAEHSARLVRVGERHAQLRLASPVVAARGDRVVLREGAATLGGGVVLDPAPPRRRSAERLALLERGDPASIVLAALSAEPEPVRREELAARGLLSPDELDLGLGAAARAGDWYMTPERLEEIRLGAVRALDERAAASSLDPGVPVSELLPQRPWATALLPLLPIERRGAKAYAPGATARLGDRVEAADRLEDELERAGFVPTPFEDAELARYLEEAGRLVRLGDGLAVGASAYDEARALLVAECETAGSIALARFRDLLGTGRKPAQLLLERFDADGLTRRVGDERVLRRRARAG
ncbi:MAG TPA: selenocysteine-specific translation elongation factor [Gaiellaceae bacterium]|nr:selenocysteine-specific translation elongation factor [Gaiellaceae bacterium]